MGDVDGDYVLGFGLDSRETRHGTELVAVTSQPSLYEVRHCCSLVQLHYTFHTPRHVQHIGGREQSNVISLHSPRKITVHWHQIVSRPRTGI